MNILYMPILYIQYERQTMKESQLCGSVTFLRIENGNGQTHRENLGRILQILALYNDKH